jgi:hypothetical protein
VGTFPPLRWVIRKNHAPAGGLGDFPTAWDGKRTPAGDRGIARLGDEDFSLFGGEAGAGLESSGGVNNLCQWPWKIAQIGPLRIAHSKEVVGSSVGMEYFHPMPENGPGENPSLTPPAHFAHFPCDPSGAR